MAASEDEAAIDAMDIDDVLSLLVGDNCGDDPMSRAKQVVAALDEDSNHVPSFEASLGPATGTATQGVAGEKPKLAKRKQSSTACMQEEERSRRRLLKAVPSKAPRSSLVHSLRGHHRICGTPLSNGRWCKMPLGHLGVCGQ